MLIIKEYLKLSNYMNFLPEIQIMLKMVFEILLAAGLQKR